ncbi:MAG: thiamine pyrophosphate-dependent dehydrogenase E1 component subunit alpha [Ardenticatenaceae bacterium]|nr:thiamine pyrophosphate-dependent dehydrogenase E1 component subunit alpha [Ardenticatenaceae bacterium]HBY92806.1 2-oxoisovalerate dehydrogenase [Chloroflexota bacterium]
MTDMLVRTTRHAEVGLTDEQVWRMYRFMRLARLLDDRMWLLNRQGVGHFAVPGNGHEAVAVGYAMALRPGHDWLAPHYRDLAGLLLIGMTPEEVMHNYFATAADVAGAGRQNYAHWGHRPLRIKTLSSPQGPHVPHGVGIAHACKLRTLDEVVWIGYGDGTSSKGDVHEALNFAAIHKLPCVFCCENNGYAISVDQKHQMAVENVADRAVGYGIPGVVVDGTDPLAVFAVAIEAIARARRGEGPSLIEAKCIRLLPHTSNDDDRHYRSKEELAADRARDPIDRFRQYLISVGLNDEEREAGLQHELDRLVEAAAAVARQSPAAPGADGRCHVYADDSLVDEQGFYR